MIAPRVGGVVVASDTFPGSWGWGASEASAVVEWKRNGGRGGRLVFGIDPYWSGAGLDGMGNLHAVLTDNGNLDVPHRDRPPVARTIERVTPGGKRTDVVA